MMTEMTMVMLVGLMIPLLGTMLGSAFVFFMKEEMSVQLQKLLLGFASGVMVAASVWSLLIPAMEMEPKGGFLVCCAGSCWFSYRYRLSVVDRRADSTPPF